MVYAFEFKLFLQMFKGYVPDGVELTDSAEYSAELFGGAHFGLIVLLVVID